jgi:anti-anti-sigma factor
MSFVLEETRLAVGVEEVRVRGELDLATADRVRRAIISAAGKGSPVLLDLCSCGFIDSTGLALLLYTHRTLHEQLEDGDHGQRGARFAVLIGESEVRKLLRVSAIDLVVPVFADRVQALASLTTGRGARQASNQHRNHDRGRRPEQGEAGEEALERAVVGDALHQQQPDHMGDVD